MSTPFQGFATAVQIFPCSVATLSGLPESHHRMVSQNRGDLFPAALADPLEEVLRGGAGSAPNPLGHDLHPLAGPPVIREPGARAEEHSLFRFFLIGPRTHLPTEHFPAIFFGIEFLPIHKRLRAATGAKHIRRPPRHHFRSGQVNVVRHIQRGSTKY